MIDGVWYRREAEYENLERDIELTFSRSCSYETDQYCWEAVRLQRGEDESLGYYPGVDVKFTDKTEKPWTEEYWDSDAWLRGILAGNPESLENAEETMCRQGLADFRNFLRRLVELGWLTNG